MGTASYPGAVPTAIAPAHMCRAEEISLPSISGRKNLFFCRFDRLLLQRINNNNNNNNRVH